MPTIADRERLTVNCAILLRMASELGIPSLVTEQYVQGLGRTVERVSRAMPDPSWRIEKTQFSAMVDVVVERLTQWRRPHVLIAGIEAHVCVLQTVLDLQDAGYLTFICTDAISASQRDQIVPALERMQSAGAVLTGVMSAMYELLGDARHACFKQCLELAKSISQ